MNTEEISLKLAEKPKPGSIILELPPSDDQKIQGFDPYTALFRDTLMSAHNLQASDIHFQPTKEGMDIRFRIHGDLMTWKKLSLEHRKSFIHEVKRLAHLSIAISGKAQDGRVSYDSWKLDLRASLLPSQFGEKIVLRLLDLTRKFELSSLGFDSETEADLKKALGYKNGVLIVSGPTGSGKTTTLYTLLCALDRKVNNVMTLEDPIEYSIEGLTQVQVSKKLTFTDALRSVLRQDPDIILVGEIRDAETAELCIKAASTGHLVLSTLHANGATQVIERLIHLGIDSDLLKSVLRFSAAQRLVKKLCTQCSLPLTEEEGDRTQIRLKKEGLPISPDPSWRRRNPQGCNQCKDGIIGRLPVLEYMTEGQVKDFLSGGETKLSVSLKSAGFKKVQKGEADDQEVFQLG